MTYRYFSEKHLKNRVRATFAFAQDDIAKILYIIKNLSFISSGGHEVRPYVLSDKRYARSDLF